MTQLIDTIHTRHVHRRRVRVLAEHLARRLPEGSSVLDVGCGDGQVAAAIMQHHDRKLQIEGIEVLVRPGQALIPVRPFDGSKIPFPDASFDAVMFVDVLHHTDNPMVLLSEAARVSRRSILIKDHLLQGVLAEPTLRFMDRVGNARYGVALPYNYWTRQQWLDAFARLGLAIHNLNRCTNLYPFPAKLLFGRSLHFVAELHKESQQP